MSNGDYVLGTNAGEVERLGLQHVVWRARVLSAFRRASISRGHTVVDVGAGPGFVSLDLADIVGAEGKVIALERAPHFAEILNARALANVKVFEHDVATPFPVEHADFSWCRWLLSFVTDPEAVIRNIAAALKPGGTAIFHEYADYGSWRMFPPTPLHERFRTLVVQSWRDSGGEPDIALWIPRWLHLHGFELVSARTYADIISPGDFTWKWPQAFMATNAARLHELGYLDANEVDTLASALDDCAPETQMMTPIVAEFIARKR